VLRGVAQHAGRFLNPTQSQTEGYHVTSIKLPFVAALLATAVLTAPVQAQIQKPVLAIETAKKIAAGCEERARKEGWSMTIAVVDASGQLKHYSRMDNSIGISVGLAQSKAATSASLPVSTRKFREIARNNALGLELTPGMSTVAGGLPVLAGTSHLGGIGVSGGSEDQDEVCAQAGLDAARDLLK
jgi:glc operon protein GlcG